VTTIYLPNNFPGIFGTGIDPDDYFSEPQEQKEPHSRKRYIPIINYDKYCLFRALEVGRVRHDSGRIKEAKTDPKDPKVFTEKKFKNLKKDSERQRVLAIELMREVGISFEDESYGLESIKKVYYKIKIPFY
jgi:hypothetical protein